MALGGTIKLTGESEYKKALAGITSNLKVLNSEMKVVTSQYDKNDKSTSNLSQQNDVLNKKIAEQKEKVNILSKALADAENETGENSETTKKWKIALNEAQSELNKLEKNVKDNKKTMEQSSSATDENTESIDKFGKEAEESGKQALKLGDIIKANLISDAIKGGLSALVGGIKQIGSAFINVGKQAMDSYGEYEQLVGGVNTLFGESGKQVQEYASNAYKTAGLSANQYMETVTSFSASLIASLDGDTAKAGEVANRAIIDMSDNANKMGTSMESIQNAYQGFAKQNYTMLDNLKLGYGGTKEEMQRLIAEASQMTAVQERLGITVENGNMSFANIANAISVVQANMGIAGATSAEASTTMQGSMSAMKASWQNLITGIADENANFEQLIDNFIASIIGTNGEGGIIANFLPRIESVVNGISKLVVGLGDELLPKVIEIATGLIGNIIQTINDNIGIIIEAGERIFQTLLDGIMEHSGNLISLVVKLVNWLAQTVMENLPTVLQAGIDILLALINGIIEVSGELIPVAIDCVVSLVETLLDNLDLLVDAGIDLILALAEGLIYAIPDLIDKAPVIITKLIDAIVSNFPKIISMAGELIGKMASGLIVAIPRLLTAIPEIIAQLINGFFRLDSEVKNIGANLVGGIWEGISGSMQWIKNQLSYWVGNVTDFIKRMFGINSPSKLFKEQIGTNLALGIGEGFGDTMHDVSADMANAIPTEFDTNINTNISTGRASFSNYDTMVLAFKQALTEVKVVMNNREMGAFVTDTIERAVYV